MKTLREWWLKFWAPNAYERERGYRDALVLAKNMSVVEIRESIWEWSSNIPYNQGWNAACESILRDRAREMNRRLA